MGTGVAVHAQGLQLQAESTEKNVQQGRMLLDSDTNESANGNVETEFKVEEGEMADGDPDRPLITGQAANDSENQGIEHEDIGITSDDSSEDGTTKKPDKASAKLMEASNSGTHDGEDDDVSEIQHNETDLEFLRERASNVSVSAVEVRGWDPEKKEELLKTVKEQAEVRSGEDLEQFARGVLILNPEVESIDTGTTSVSMKYHVPARFLGIFKTTLEQETTVTFGDGKHGRVKVKFPWLRMFYSIDARLHAEELERTLLPEIDDEVLVDYEGGEVGSKGQAEIIQKILSFITS